MANKFNCYLPHTPGLGEQLRLDYALREAAGDRNLDAVNYFIELGAKADTVKGPMEMSSDNSVQAVSGGYETEPDPKILARLLTTKPDLKIKDHNGRTAVHSAAELCHEPTLRLLTQYDPDCVNYTKTYHNYTALHSIAHATGSFSFIEPSTAFSASPKPVSAPNNHFGCLKLLLEASDKSINAQDINGYTVLQTVLMNDAADADKILPLLFEHGADGSINAVNRHGETALDFARRRKNPNAINLLLSHDAISMKDDSRWSWEKKVETKPKDASKYME